MGKRRSSMTGNNPIHAQHKIDIGLHRYAHGREACPNVDDFDVYPGRQPM